MQVRKQEQYFNFLQLQDQLIKAQTKSKSRDRTQSSAFSGVSKFSRQSKKSDQIVGGTKKGGRQQTLPVPSSLLQQGKGTQYISELNQNFIIGNGNERAGLADGQLKNFKNRKIRSRNRNFAMDHQSLPKENADQNVLNQVIQLQAKIGHTSQENLKIEDQDQLTHTETINKRQARSRNAAIRQSLSQNTASIINPATVAERTEVLTDGSQPRPQGPMGLQNQYQQMLIGDQSLAQLTQLTLNSMGPSVQDDQSIHRLNDHLQDLSSNTNSNSKVGPENHLENFSASVSKMPKKLMPQNFFGVGATPTPYNAALVTPYDNQISQQDLRNLNMVMNLNKGRNVARIHGTHQQTAQVPMKNIGATDNPSSVDDTSNINSSSMLTIGLPSVMSQGGPNLLQVRNPNNQQPSNINLNMNMNFNISNPLQIEDQSEQQQQQPQSHSGLSVQPGNTKQQSSQHKRRIQRNQNMGALKQVDSKEILGMLSIHDTSKIQQLLSVQRSNQNSLKTLSAKPQQQQPEQIQNIYNNIQKLNFNDQARIPVKYHHKQLTNVSNFQSQGGANQRRLIPLKSKNAHQSMAIPKNYLTEQQPPEQQMLQSKKNFRIQNSSGQSRQNNKNRAKTIPVKLQNAIQQPDVPVSSSHANSAENLRQTVAEASKFQQPEKPAPSLITIQNQKEIQPNKTNGSRHFSQISTALQNFKQAQKPQGPKEKILSMPSQQLSQILLKKIPIQQQKEKLEKKQFQTDSHSFQSSSKISQQNESSASKKDVPMLRQGSQKSLGNGSKQMRNTSIKSPGEFGAALASAIGSAAAPSDQISTQGFDSRKKSTQKQFESTNPYELNVQKQIAKKNEKIQDPQLIQLVQEKRKLGQVEQEKKKVDVTFDQGEMPLESLVQSPNQTTITNDEKGQGKNDQEEPSSSMQIRSGVEQTLSPVMISPDAVSGTGSQQIQQLQQRTSAVKVKREHEIANATAGIIDFGGFDQNSFEDESSSHQPERLEAMESQQFDTNMDLQFQDLQSNRRIDCENTELELEPVHLGLEQDMEYERQAAELDQAAKPYQYNLISERSQNVFEQRSVRNELNDSQVFSSSDQYAPPEIHQHGLGSSDMINAIHGNQMHGINQYDERDQLQTAIVLQSGSASSRESSSQLLADDTDQSCYIRRQTPAFKDKHRHQRLEATGHRRSRDEFSTAEREELHTVVIRQTQPSRWNSQQDHMPISRQSKDMHEDDNSTQNFARQFGITQTLERKSREYSDDGESEASNGQNYNDHQQQKYYSRNRRFHNQSRTISNAYEARPHNEHKSLEQRLKEEELLESHEFHRRGNHRTRSNRNRLLDSSQTIVSKQRVRQVPVSNTPKRLRNISTAKKGRRGSRHSQSGKEENRENILSMKQDSNKKNVYHIFGKQTSESYISVKQKSIDGGQEPRTSAQPTTGGVGIKEGREVNQAISESQKKQRKLLFALSQKQQSSLNHNFDENYNNDMRTNQHMQRSVQSFSKQQKRIPVTSLIERPRVSDYQEHHKIKMPEQEQYRTVEALPRRRLYQHHQHQEGLEEYGNQEHMQRKQWDPSDQVIQSSGIDSEEECYGDNWYSVGQPRPVQVEQHARKSVQSQHQQNRHKIHRNRHKPEKNYQAVLEMREINQGVTYDKQGRGRRTLGGSGTDGERLIFYNNQSRTMSPRKDYEDPYREGQVLFSPGDRNHQRQHYSSLTREVPDHASRGSAQHKMMSNQSIEYHADGTQRRVKKPKDIYALKVEHQPVRYGDESEDQLQLISYNPPDKNCSTSQNPLDRYNFVDYDDLEPQSYMELHHQQSPTHDDPRYLNFVTIPYQSRTTKLIPAGSQSLNQHPDDGGPIFQIQNFNDQRPPRGWKEQTQQQTRHKRLVAKSKESFTRNRLNREANASTEMICQDNVVILGSPKPSNKPHNLPAAQGGGSDQQVSGMRKLQRGRVRQAPVAGAKHRRVAMSQDPAIGSKSNQSLDGNPGKKNSAQNLAAWCCLHSKSRAASCESAQKADHSDNASSVCSVF